ncbi:MAG: clostripain-related cysteine peptidase, partial [Anaerolineales bacterium]
MNAFILHSSIQIFRQHEKEKMKHSLFKSTIIALMLSIAIQAGLFIVKPNLTVKAQGGTNLALGKAAYASSVHTSNVASRVTDGLSSTAWSSTFAEPAWIYIDLGSPQTIQQVILIWESAYGGEYQIEGSTNATTWTILAQEFHGDGGTDYLSVSGTWRYIRMHGMQRGTGWGFSILEFQVLDLAQPVPPVEPYIPSLPPKPASQILFSDDFSSGNIAEWQIERGTWQVTDGALTSSFPCGGGISSMITAGDTTWTDYQLTVDVRRLAGYDPGGILVRNSAGGYYSVDILPSLPYGGAVRIVKSTTGASVQRSWPFTANSWYKMIIDVEGPTIDVYVVDTAQNAKLLLSYTDTDAPFLTGNIGFSMWAGAVCPTQVAFDNIYVRQIEPSYLVSGVVKDSNGDPISEVQLSANSVGTSTMTRLDGTYVLGRFVSGTYTLAPAKSGYIFSPALQTVNMPPDVINQDFTGVVAYSISGNVGVDGAALNYTDGTPKVVTADASGNYSLTVPYDWSGMVTPTKVGYTFSPLSSDYANVQVDQTDQDYTALPAWTIMVYLDGDNAIGNIELDDNYVNVFNQLEYSANQPGVNIAVLWDRLGDNNSYYYKVQSDSDLERLGDYIEGVDRINQGEINMGDPASLSDFITWARAHYPAQHYALLISDHGTGLNGIALDTTGGGDWLTIHELGTALSTATSSGSEKLDIVFADACLMGMIEDGYQIRNYANIYIASQNPIFIPNDKASKSPYADYIADITVSTTPEQLAEVFVTKYARWLDTAYPDTLGYTLSAVDLTRIDPLVTAITNLSNTLRPQMAAYASQIQNARGNTQKFDSDNNFVINDGDKYVDLADLALNLKSIPDANVQNGAQSVIDTANDYVIFKAAKSGTVRYPISDLDPNHVNGVSIFFPDGTLKRSFYNGINLEFASSAVWGAQSSTDFSSPAYVRLNEKTLATTLDPFYIDGAFVPTTYRNLDRSFYERLDLLFSVRVEPDSLNSVNDAPLSTSEVGWGSFLVDYVEAITPSAPDDPNPPDLVAPAQTAVRISGYVGAAGVSLSYFDSTSKTAVSDESDNYSFTVPYDWSGTVTPSLPGYTFTPVSKSYSNVLTDKSDENYFAATPAHIKYAEPGGLLDGSCDTWINACELRYALSAAVSGDEIWVMAGTYKPTDGTDRTISFVLKNGVALYGGFDGTETLRAQRDPGRHVSILSGDLGIVGTTTDNSYHVVVGSGTDGTAVLDGFTITCG